MEFEDVEKSVKAVGDLLIEVVKECARDEKVYLLDEMYDAAVSKLVEKAESVGDVETVIKAAVMVGMCRGQYLGQSFVVDLDRALAYFYLSELNKRFGDRGGEKNETES